MFQTAIKSSAAIVLISSLVACGGTESYRNSDGSCRTNSGLWEVGIYSDRAGLGAESTVFLNQRGYYTKTFDDGKGEVSVHISYRKPKYVMSSGAKEANHPAYSSWVTESEGTDPEIRSRYLSASFDQRGEKKVLSGQDVILTLGNGVSVLVQVLYADSSESDAPQQIIEEITANLCHGEPREDEDLRNKLRGHWRLFWELYEGEGLKDSGFRIRASSDEFIMFDSNRDNKFMFDLDTRGGRVNWVYEGKINDSLAVIFDEENRGVWMGSFLLVK